MRIVVLLMTVMIALLAQAMPIGLRIALWRNGAVQAQLDSLPDLGVSPSDEVIAESVADHLDSALSVNITNAAEYSAFRTWALGLGGVTPDSVKASSFAWLSYALNTDALIAAAPKDGDVVIGTFERAANEGTFEVSVKIDGVEIGDDALEANIRKVFDIEGAEKLVCVGVGESGVGFSSDNVELNAAAPENGNVKFTVTPKMGNGKKPDSFFFRVKMK